MPGDRRDVESISQLYVRTSPQRTRRGRDGGGNEGARQLTRIDNVVLFEQGVAPARIDRLDRQRMVALRANIAPGFALANRLDALNAQVKEIGLPLGFDTKILGRGRELERTLKDFVWTFALSFVFMYIVLAAQYEHLVHPLVILLSLPLAVPFGLVSLFWGGETLNLYSALGILVLFGVVKKNSILQIDHANQLKETGLSTRDAIVRASRDRLRPILMTTFAFVAGMIPLIVSRGVGSGTNHAIGFVVFGGQSLALLLTLLVTPVAYSLFDDLQQRLFKRKTVQVPAMAKTVSTALVILALVVVQPPVVVHSMRMNCPIG
jgi:HAE1 family hydrophobic/amphiphilic exporter-1